MISPLQDRYNKNQINVYLGSDLMMAGTYIHIQSIFFVWFVSVYQGSDLH